MPWGALIPNQTNMDVNITNDALVATHPANNTKAAALVGQTMQAAMVTKLANPIFNPWEMQVKKGGASPIALLVS